VNAGRSSRFRAGAIGALLVASGLGLGIVAALGRAPERRESSWRGYSVLLVKSSVSEAEVLGCLGRAGIDRVISPSTESVLVSDWSKTRSMSLSEALRTLVPGDPRLDPYLQRLGSWFAARCDGVDYRAYYVDSRIPQPRIEKALASREGDFMLPDEGGKRMAAWPDIALPFLIALAIILVAATVGSSLGKSETSLRTGLARRRWVLKPDRIALRIAISLPWIAIACGGKDLAALATLWSLAFIELADSLDIPLEEYRGRGLKAAALSFRLQGVPPLLIPACSILALLLVPDALLPACSALAGSIAAIAGIGLLPGRSSGGRYVPLPIDRPKRFRALATRKANGALAFVVVLAWAAGALLEREPRTQTRPGLEYPIPQALSGSAKPSIAEARARIEAGEEASLPGLASYLAHRATQESLPFLRVGDLRSDPFAEAGLSHPGGEIESLAFDDSWARKALSSLPALSIEAMLLSQGVACSGRISGPESESPRTAVTRPLAPIRCLLYIFLLIAPLARFSRGLSFTRESTSDELRQEA
jgi:hypothetical protein